MLPLTSFLDWHLLNRLKNIRATVLSKNIGQPPPGFNIKWHVMGCVSQFFSLPSMHSDRACVRNKCHTKIIASFCFGSLPCWYLQDSGAQFWMQNSDVGFENWSFGECWRMLTYSVHTARLWRWDRMTLPCLSLFRFAVHRRFCHRPSFEGFCGSRSQLSAAACDVHRR